MLGFAPIAATPIASLRGDDSLAGLQATVQQGTLGVEVSVQLTGQSCSVSQGTLSPVTPLLFAQVATVSPGVLGIEVSVGLTGQSSTAAQGALGIVSGVTLTGQVIASQQGQFMPRLAGAVITSQRGTLTSEIGTTLVGAVITTQTQSVGYITVTGGNVTIQLDVAGNNLFQGSLAPGVQVGTAALTWTENPVATTSTASGQSFTFNLDRVQQQFTYYQGKYVGAGETHDGAASDWATVIASSLEGLDTTTRDDASFGVGANVIGLHTLNPKFNGNAFQTFDRSGITYSAAPRKWGLGFQFGVGAEGNLAAIRTRTEDRFLTYPNRTRYFGYQAVLDWEPFFWLGPEYGVDIDNSLYESSGGAEDGPVNNSMGVVPLRPTFSKTPLDDTTPKQSALIFFPSLWNNGADNWVPTFVKVSMDIRTNATYTTGVPFIGNPIQLRSFTGVSNLWAMQNSLVVTHSGYGEVAYLTYLASTSGAPRTPSYVGLIVMDLGTLEVFSHTVKALSAISTTYTPLDSRYAQYDVPHRPVSEAVRLSNGRSVTQFAIRGYVVNLSWTQGTHRSPVLTPKDGPVTSGGSNYLARGVDYLEVRGDTVLHILWRVNTATSWTSTSITANYRPYTNDVTGTGATWNLAGADTWSWTLSWGSSFTHYPAFYAGAHQGKQSWLYQSEYRINTATEGLRGGQAWIDFWSGLPVYESVEATARVGQVVASFSECGLTVQLTGQAITSYAFGLRPTGINVSAALTGLQTYVNYTGVGGHEHVSVPLTGFGAEVSPGRMSLIGDPVNVTLAGQHICCQWQSPESLPPGTVPLSGFAITSGRGQLQPQLQGATITSAHGTLTPFSDLLVGKVVTCSGGVLAPLVEPTATGQAAAFVQGTLGVSSEKNLAGQAAASASGVLKPAVAVALTGQQISSAKGSVSIQVDDQGDLTGLACTVSGGTLKPVVTVNLAVSPIAVSRGAMGVTIVRALTGSSCAVGTSTLSVAITRLLPSQLIAMVYGSPGLVTDNHPSVTGLQMACVLGAPVHNGTPSSKDVNLWAQQELEKLFASSLPPDTESFVTITPKR